MRRSGAFSIAVLLILWMTPALYAAENSGATTAAQPAYSSSTAAAQPAYASSTAVPRWDIGVASIASEAQPADSANTAAAQAATPVHKALAPIFSINDFMAFYTTAAKPDETYGYGTPDHDLLSFQFEHFSFHPWGEMYVDAEMYQGRDVGAPFVAPSNGLTANNWVGLFVFNPYLSLSKVTKRKVAWGPITDVQLVARFERESYFDFWSRNFGPDLILKVPGFAWFESGVLARYDNVNKKNTFLWRSVLLSKPLVNYKEAKFNFNLLSLINGTASNHLFIFERADFLAQVPHYSRLQGGLRLEVENYQITPGDLDALIGEENVTGNYATGDSRYKRVMPEVELKYIF